MSDYSGRAEGPDSCLLGPVVPTARPDGQSWTEVSAYMCRGWSVVTFSFGDQLCS